MQTFCTGLLLPYVGPTDCELNEFILKSVFVLNAGVMRPLKRSMEQTWRMYYVPSGEMSTFSEWMDEWMSAGMVDRY